MLRDVSRRTGGHMIYEDCDDGDQIIVEPVINSFAPVRGTVHCICGAPLQPWTVRCVTVDSVELCCHRCYRVLGRIELAVRIYR